MAFEIEVQAPSNIAFLKYWGKSDPLTQWPAGNSLSMTLKHAKTVTKASLSETDQVLFDGTISSDRKIFKALDLLREQTGLKSRITIDTYNTFPKSCGIASSASGMAALTIASIACWTGSRSFEELERNGYSKTRLSHLARLCSGSAGRSLFGGYVEWLKGDTSEQQIISPKFSANHWPLANLILIVSDKTKAISSTEAHAAAWTSPLFRPRLSVLQERQSAMLAAIKEKDLLRLGPLIEADALEMHSIIMTATPSVSYLSEETLNLVSWIRRERQKGSFKAWFTIDAGPNVHLIAEPQDLPNAKTSLSKAFPTLTMFQDEVGDGPQIQML
ncbi:MAG: diphosphomevalonate decarboxylase [Pseudomonadota bacterium]